MNDQQLLAQFDARVTRLDAALREPRSWHGPKGVLTRGQRSGIGIAGTSVLMVVTLLGVVSLASLAIGFGVGRSPSATPATIVVANEAPFPASFLEATPWGSGILVDRPTAPDRYPSLDRLIAHLDAFFVAGIKVPRPNSGVTITVPEGAPTAKEVHLFVTVLGGATDASSGAQFRVVARHDDAGWWFDDQAEWRVFCDLPLVAPALPDGQPRPGMCLGSSDPDRG